MIIERFKNDCRKTLFLARGWRISGTNPLVAYAAWRGEQSAGVEVDCDHVERA